MYFSDHGQIGVIRQTKILKKLMTDYLESLPALIHFSVNEKFKRFFLD